MVVKNYSKKKSPKFMVKKKKPLTQKELSIMAGKATLKKHGKPHFSKMAMARWHPEEYAKKYGAKK
jgi:hypothetical protein